MNAAPAQLQEVRIPNRQLMKLLELPVLFYLVCLTLVITLRVDAEFVYLAWAFFISRVVHSYVHLTYNNVIYRLNAFALSSVILTIIWIRLFIHLL